jgi:competence protein ComEC
MLDIRFLNVGHGDCTIIEFPSKRLAMVDINNSKSLPEADVEALAESKGLTVALFERLALREGRSWDDYYRSLLVDPSEYFATHFPGRGIFRYIQTHPDMDHMSGLFRFFWQDEIALENMWDTEHSKELEESDFVNSGYAHEDWLTYQLMRNGHLKDESTHKVLHPLQGAAAHYYVDDGISLLGPTQDLIDYCNGRGDSWNNASFVLRVEYGGRSVILPGDAEKPEWDKIETTVDPAKLKCDILKAAHHGRQSGYSESAVDLMDPSYVICSVGKKPSTDASDEYASHGATVLSTRYHGTIRMQMWYDGEIWIDDHSGQRIGRLPPL